MGRGALRERDVRGGGETRAEMRRASTLEMRRARGGATRARKSGGRHAESTWQERGRTKGSGGARGGVRNVASADVSCAGDFLSYLRDRLD
jgi:hypothetical protein